MKICVPCCTDLSVLRHDCFFRIVGTTISHMTSVKGYSVEWENLGGSSTSDIGCLAWGDNHLLIYQLDDSNHLMANTYSKEFGWFGWETIKSVPLREIPSCVEFGPGTVHCLGRERNGSSGSVRCSESKWSKVDTPDAMLSGPIDCTSSDEERADCFAAGLNGQLLYSYWTSETSWTKWLDLGGYVLGRASPVSPKPQSLKVFTMNKLKRVWNIEWDGEIWSKWHISEMWGPELMTSPECLMTRNGRIDCFAAASPDGKLSRISFDGAKWSEWMEYNYNIHSKPVCKFHKDGLIYCLLLIDPPKWTLMDFKVGDVVV